MYNFLLAFVICTVIVVIGEIVTYYSKAWIPSVFVSAVILLIGYWTVLPHDLVSNSYLISIGGTLCIFLLITHMGTVISLKRLIEQWKTVVTCLFGLLGMCLISYFVAPMFMEREFVIAGLPPLTGGIVAATMMQSAAAKAGLAEAAVFAISMYCIQGFAGYPLTAVCLKKEGKRLLADYRAGKLSINEAEVEAMKNAAKLPEESKKRLPLMVPAHINSPIMMLGKLGLIAWIASMVGAVTGISGAIWALVLGVIFCTLGFLEQDLLHKCNSYNIVMFGLMMFVFDGLKDCTPQMLQNIIYPMIVLIIVGVFGLGLFAFIIAKVLKISFPMAFANCLTALYGFPFDAIITESTCNSLAANKEEKEFLMSKMFPSMIVGGFTTVTITSVFIASIFAKLL